jgi:hypothetical protein
MVRIIPPARATELRGQVEIRAQRLAIVLFRPVVGAPSSAACR